METVLFCSVTLSVYCNLPWVFIDASFLCWKPWISGDKCYNLDLEQSEWSVTKNLTNAHHQVLLWWSTPSVLWCCWLGGRKVICKNWVVKYRRGYLFGARCKWFACNPADATATPSSLAPVKSRTVYLSGASLCRLSWKKSCMSVFFY